MKRNLVFVFLGLAVTSAAQRKEPERPALHAARGTKGAVACGSEYAAEAGMRMYFHGGNAVDAGVASMLAASIAEFSHLGFGGEAPILIRTKAGKVFAIAGEGPMPKRGTAARVRQPRPRAEALLWSET